MIGVVSTSAVSEPRTTVTTTTDFSRFLDGATFGAYQTDCRRCDCSCVCVCVCVCVLYMYVCMYVCISQNTKGETQKQSLLGMREDMSIYMALILNLRLQASSPSNHL